METLIIGNIVHVSITNIYNLMKDIVQYNLDEINSCLEQLGVDGTLQIVTSLLEECKTEEIKFKKTANTIILDIQNNINCIHSEYDNLKKLIENHTQKYLYYWRNIDYFYHIEKIKSYNKTLLSRTKILLELIKN